MSFLSSLPNWDRLKFINIHTFLQKNLNCVQWLWIWSKFSGRSWLMCTSTHRLTNLSWMNCLAGRTCCSWTCKTFSIDISFPYVSAAHLIDTDLAPYYQRGRLFNWVLLRSWKFQICICLYTGQFSIFALVHFHWAWLWMTQKIIWNPIWQPDHQTETHPWKSD